jgi:hypothetical protein
LVIESLLNEAAHLRGNAASNGHEFTVVSAACPYVGAWEPGVPPRV